MQEFLTNNTVNCNLMSLTGYRTLVLLKMLLESPKSNNEINSYFFNDQYIKEKFSNDTLRIYINSLREIGCDITRANKSNKNKYELLSHPFDFEITKQQFKAVSKLYKNIYDKLDFSDVIKLDNLFAKIADEIGDEKMRESILNISMLKGIDKNVLNELIMHCKNKNQITFLHKSPKSGLKEIEVIADKLLFKSDKLYLFGCSITHDEYSFYRVDRIQKVSTIKINKDSKKPTELKVIYEIYDMNYSLSETEKLIHKTNSKMLIEVCSNNKFSLMQRFLHSAKDCKILSPESFKAEFLKKLKSMKESYN